MDSIIIRKSIDCIADRNFVLSSWIENNRYSPEYYFVPYRIYRERQERIIEEILKRNVKVLLAVNANDLTQYVGYIVYEDTLNNDKVVHWAYVKQDFRKMGIGKYLLEQAGVNLTQPIIMSHSSKDVYQIYKARKAKFVQIPEV